MANLTTSKKIGTKVICGWTGGGSFYVRDAHSYGAIPSLEMSRDDALALAMMIVEDVQVSLPGSVAEWPALTHAKIMRLEASVFVMKAETAGLIESLDHRNKEIQEITVQNESLRAHNMAQSTRLHELSKELNSAATSGAVQAELEELRRFRDQYQPVLEEHTLELGEAF